MTALAKDVPVQAKKRNPMSTALLFLSFGLVFLILFNEPLREWLGRLAGYGLEPAIGFGGSYPILTIFLASVVLVILTTVIRHFLVDWVNMARVQEAMRAFQKEFSQARKDNNTYKIKKLTEAQPEIMQLQASMSAEQMKPMAATMIIVVPIFAWLYHFIDTTAATHQAMVPWNTDWDFTQNWWFLPRWILLYSLFGIPFGQIAQRVLKLWEYRHHDLDGDGKTPAGDNA